MRARAIAVVMVFAALATSSPLVVRAAGPGYWSGTVAPSSPGWWYDGHSVNGAYNTVTCTGMSDPVQTAGRPVVGFPNQPVNGGASDGGTNNVSTCGPYDPQPAPFNDTANATAGGWTDGASWYFGDNAWMGGDHLWSPFLIDLWFRPEPVSPSTTRSWVWLYNSAAVWCSDNNAAPPGDGVAEGASDGTCAQSDALFIASNDDWGTVCFGLNAIKWWCGKGTGIIDHWNNVALYNDGAGNLSLWWEGVNVDTLTQICSYGDNVGYGCGTSGGVGTPHGPDGRWGDFVVGAQELATQEDMSSAFPVELWGIGGWVGAPAEAVMTPCDNGSTLCKDTSSTYCDPTRDACNYLGYLVLGTGSGDTFVGSGGSLHGGGSTGPNGQPCANGSSAGIISGECKFQFGMLQSLTCTDSGDWWNPGDDISFVGCNLANVGIAIANIFIGIANGIIDLLVPGSAIVQPWQALWTNASGRVPFQWITASWGVVSNAAGASESTPSFSSDVPLGAGTGAKHVTATFDLQNMLAPVAPYRGIIAGGLVVWFAVYMYGRARSYLAPQDAIQDD